jgi:NAD(P)-dependent dehydrogenase (short-subunit alcohol dehydrogenase family)
LSAFEGRKAVVTGAANGIGRAITEALVARGATVVAADVHADDLNATFGETGAVHCVVHDVTADDAPEAIVDAAASKMGGLDFLINNAGIAIAGDFETLTDEQFDTIMSVNVRSMFRLSRAAVSHLKNSDQARIVNLGSIMSDLGGPSLAIYGASKHAVAGLSKGMAVDLGKHGITVNYLQPGAIWTKMSEPFMDDPDFKAYWEGKAPAGRLGQPEEVASACMYLLSEEARFVSGLGFNVDGGAIVQF